ncbi:MAG: hypothetical protein M3N16_00550 [Actinomycetota bacterium]|nr:hypothetical protein [Actinomycetota bacterium]
MSEGPATNATGRELMRRRVERRLEMSLLSLGLDLRRKRRRPRGDTLSDFEETVAAFSAAGLLSGAEAAAWGELFARALAAVRPPTTRSSPRRSAPARATSSRPTW